MTKKVNHTFNADRTAAVAVDYTWLYDMNACPRGVLVQLLVRNGCAVHGRYTGQPHFEAWAPMPKRVKPQKEKTE